MFSKHHISIPETLRGFVRKIWVLDPSDGGGRGVALGGEGVNGAEGAGGGGFTGGGGFSVYADGCPGIIFQQAAGGLLLNQDKKLSPTFLYGQTVQPVRMDAEGPLKMIVVNFQPHVVHSIFRFSAKEVTDDCLDLSLLPAVPRVNLTEQLWNTVSVEQQVKILFDYMQQVIVRNRSTVDAGMAYATSQLLRLHGGLRVNGEELRLHGESRVEGESRLKELQRELNLTERTFERRFEQYIGVSPRVFSKISQFQAALTQLRSGRFQRLSDIAYEHGYADQSHFIRSFKKFTGVAPLEFRRQVSGEEGDFPGTQGFY